MTVVQSTLAFATFTRRSARDALLLYFEPLVDAWRRLGSIDPRSRKLRIERARHLSWALERHLPEMSMALIRPSAAKLEQELILPIRRELEAELLSRLMRGLNEGQARAVAQELMVLPKEELELEVRLLQFHDRLGAWVANQDSGELAASMQKLWDTAGMLPIVKPTFVQRRLSGWRVFALEMISFYESRLLQRRSESLQKSLIDAHFEQMDLLFYDWVSWERTQTLDVVRRVEQLPPLERSRLLGRARIWSALPKDERRSTLLVLEDVELFRELEHLPINDWTTIVLHALGHWNEPGVGMKLLLQIRQAIKNRA